MPPTIIASSASKRAAIPGIFIYPQIRIEPLPDHFYFIETARQMASERKPKKRTRIKYSCKKTVRYLCIAARCGGIVQ